MGNLSLRLHRRLVEVSTGVELYNCHKARILVQVTISCRLRIGRDGPLAHVSLVHHKTANLEEQFSTSFSLFSIAGTVA